VVLAVSAVASFVPALVNHGLDRIASPLTDPTVHDYRSGFLRRDSPPRSKECVIHGKATMGGDAGFVHISPTSTTPCEFGD